MSDLSENNLVEKMLDAFTAKDLEAALAFFHDDAVLYDPHYPRPEMKGREAIRQGLEWGLTSLEQPGFSIRNLWLDTNKGVVELDTHHIIRRNMETKYPQVFVFEIRDGLFTRLQSYVPYGPHGVPGLVTRISRLIWRLKGKMR